MRRSILRSILVAWPAAAVAAIVFTAAAVRAQDEHPSEPHATAENQDAEHPHGDAEDGHQTGADRSAADDEHGGVDYDVPDLFFHPKLFFWSLGVFLLFLFVAKKLAWTPLIRGLDAREARVNQALHDAEAARVEAEKLLARHDARMAEVQEEVKDIVAAARKEAETEKARIIAEADAEAAALRDQAIAEIEAAHRQAIDDLDARIDQQAAVATEHVLGQTR